VRQGNCSQPFPYSHTGRPLLRFNKGDACRRAGIKGLRFHDLRHTTATRMLENGASIVDVSKILGHSDLKTTMRYAHPDESLKKAVENLVKNSISVK
jgi:integrase